MSRPSCWDTTLDTAWSEPGPTPADEERMHVLRQYRDVLRELAGALSEALDLPLVPT